MKKIALEEHFAAPEFSEYEAGVEKMMKEDDYCQFRDRLPEFDEQRLEAMDKAGIEVCVLSQTSPGLQAEKDALLALTKAQRVNDFLKQQIDRHPTRYAGFAHLAMHDCQAATKELERCITELGFKGALINGHTGGVYLDNPIYLPFWEKIVELDVPVYLHPADSFDSPHMYDGFAALKGAAWGWGVETATHALRLVASGLFDRLPQIKIILGHMGETLPFTLWRLDSRWQISKHDIELQKLPSQYLRENFVVTTSGVCDETPLKCAIEAIGINNVLFSTDYPFESVPLAFDFIEKAQITEAERAKICYENAERLLKIKST
ncbi:amidohydrolase family protein [soil metagenome]